MEQPVGLQSMGSQELDMSEWLKKKKQKHTTILEKEMALHSSVFAWEIPQTEEPGGLQSVVARVIHDLVTKIINYYIND